MENNYAELAEAYIKRYGGVRQASEWVRNCISVCTVLANKNPGDEMYVEKVLHYEKLKEVINQRQTS